ncbi:MAG: FG-GAP-like repeat-containing protein, partial [Planctomycetota bacterium]
MKNNRPLLFGMTAIVGGAVAMLVLLTRQTDPNPEDPDVLATSEETRRADELLQLTIGALAATENRDNDEAERLWNQVISDSAAKESVSDIRNWSLHRTLVVDNLAAKALNPNLTDDERSQARSDLPPAIDLARAAIEKLKSISDTGSSDDNIIAEYLDVLIELRSAELIPMLAKRKRKTIFDRLANSLGSDSSGGTAMLVGALIDLLDVVEDPLEGIPKDYRQVASQALIEASEDHSDNLFIALRATQVGLKSQNADAAEPLRRVRSLAKAIEPSVNRELQKIGSDVESVAAQAINSIASGDFESAELALSPWFNVLIPHQIIRTDQRRCRPHPLDLLSFAAIRERSASVRERRPLGVSDTLPSFDRLTLGESNGLIDAIGIDADLDLDPDIIALNEDGVVSLYKNDVDDSARSTFTLVTETTLQSPAKGIVAADLFVVDSSDPARIRSVDRSKTDRHDTFQQLVVYGEKGISVIAIDGRSETDDAQRLIALPDNPESVLSSIGSVTSVVCGDLEADGDLDLIVADDSGLRLILNRGNRTFFESNVDSRPLGGAKIISMAIADLDRDLDLDILALDESGQTYLLENLLHLQFRLRTLEEVPAIENPLEVRVEDLDGNVSWDIVLLGGNETKVAFSQTSDIGIWRLDETVTVKTISKRPSLADFDNDGWMESLHDEGLVRWVGGRPIEISGDTPSSFEAVHDFNRDGLIDGIVSIEESGGVLQIAINQTQDAGRFIDARFRGIDDNATGRVNHYGIGSVLELRSGPYYWARVVNSPVTHFGLDSVERADSLRVIMPNGLTQTIRELSLDTTIEEDQELKGSCPYLYAFDGQEFRFVTDCLWAAPLGLQVAPGVVAPDRPWEYLYVDGENIKPQDEAYEFRITEELWEVAYFDHIQWTAVDHPANVEVFTNEKVGPPSISQPKLLAIEKRDLHSPKVATTPMMDASVATKRIASIDGTFVKGFDRRYRQGLCPIHWIDLQFAPLTFESREERVYLVLTGWILPTDTSLNIQIDQNNDLPKIEFPSLWVPDSDSENGWRKAIESIGFPGGKTKTMIVDVTDVIDSERPILRVQTSAQIYWDAAKLGVSREVPIRLADEDGKMASHKKLLGASTSEVRLWPLEVVSAEVASHGF